MMSEEFVSLLSLSRHDHDRDSANRSREGHLDEVWQRESTRVMVLVDGKAVGTVVSGETGEETFELSFFSPSDVSSLGLEVHERLYLGKGHDDGPDAMCNFVAVVVDAHTNSADVASSAGDLRQWGHAMSKRDTGLFTQALALANWHASHQYDPASGEPTVPTSAGWVRSTATNAQIFPRTDVAVIVLVTDDHDRILLGNNAMWESNRYSLLAGYVDPGESLEAAVRREVFEESGLQIDRTEYMGSQPWPFPASLMVGFVARVRTGSDATALRPDGEEILDLRWFTRDELSASLENIVLPGRTSIARSLIEYWYGAPLEQNAVWLGRR